MPPSQVPTLLRWVPYTSPAYYTFSATMVVNMENASKPENCPARTAGVGSVSASGSSSGSGSGAMLPPGSAQHEFERRQLHAQCLHKNSGNAQLMHYDFQDIDVGHHAAVLLAMWAGFLFLSWLLLHVQAGTVRCSCCLGS